MDQLNILKISAFLRRFAADIDLNQNPIIPYDEFEEKYQPIDPRATEISGKGTSHREIREGKGKLWFVKFYGHENDFSTTGRANPEEQAFWEWVTALLMRAAGFNTPNTILVKNNLGQGILMTELYQGRGPEKVKHLGDTLKYVPVRQKLLTDMRDKGLWPLLSILAHWDWAGLQQDNILAIGKGDDYDLKYIDTSAGKFRAQGAQKPIFSKNLAGLDDSDKKHLKEEHKEDIAATLETLRSVDSKGTGILKEIDDEGKRVAFDAMLPKVKQLHQILDRIMDYAKGRGINPEYIREIDHYKMRLTAFEELYDELYG